MSATADREYSVDRAGVAKAIGRLIERFFMVRSLDSQLEGLARSGHVGPYASPGRGALAVLGATMAMGADDRIFGTPKDWPAAIARGAGAKAVMLQMYGKGIGGGRTVPGAIQDAELGVMLSGGQAASALGIAAGWGHAARLKDADRVALAICGPGTVETALAHAAAVSAARCRSQCVILLRGPEGELGRLDGLAQDWGLSLLRVSGNHGIAVWDATAEARQRCLDGQGPVLVDARYGDPEAAPDDMLELQEAGRLSSEAERAVKAEIRTTLWAAARAAEEAPLPSGDGLVDHLWAPMTAAPSELAAQQHEGDSDAS